MIYAVDFDGTLCENKWTGIGAPNRHLITFLRARQAGGHQVILWTCRTGKLLREAVEWCGLHSLHFDAVNRPLLRIGSGRFRPRKVWADMYIDDKNMGPEEIW